jgi:hypothetical protein
MNKCASVAPDQSVRFMKEISLELMIGKSNGGGQEVRLKCGKGVMTKRESLNEIFPVTKTYQLINHNSSNSFLNLIPLKDHFAAA